MDAKPALRGSVWRGPLVPVALAFSAGILLDRHASVPLAGSLFATVIMLAAWMAACSGRSPGLPLVYLALATAASGAAWHHYRRDVLPADDVSLLLEEKPRLVQFRGLLEQEPLVNQHLPDPLRTVQRGDGPSQSTTALLKVTECRLRADWLPISGRVRLLCPAALADLHAGDTVEVVGRLTAPEEPANPGERNFARELRDQGIRAVLSCAMVLGPRDWSRRGRGRWWPGRRGCVVGASGKWVTPCLAEWAGWQRRFCSGTSLAWTETVGTNTSRPASSTSL